MSDQVAGQMGIFLQLGLFHLLEVMNTKLFVGGLSWGTTDDSLRAAFASCGTVVSAKVMMDKFTGKSRGFGFVEMASEDEAQKGIAAYDGQEIDGRKVAVNVARPLEDRGPRA